MNLCRDLSFECFPATINDNVLYLYYPIIPACRWKSLNMSCLTLFQSSVCAQAVLSVYLKYPYHLLVELRCSCDLSAEGKTIGFTKYSELYILCVAFSFVWQKCAMYTVYQMFTGEDVHCCGVSILPLEVQMLLLSLPPKLDVQETSWQKLSVSWPQGMTF